MTVKICTFSLLHRTPKIKEGGLAIKMRWKTFHDPRDRFSRRSAARLYLHNYNFLSPPLVTHLQEKGM